MEQRSLAALRRVLRGRVLFPHLRSLAVSDSGMDILFVSQSLQEVTWKFFTMESDGNDPVLAQMRDLVGRMPNVTSLSLLGVSIGTESDTGIANLCASMPCLRRLSFGPYTFSPTILRAVMHHRGLVAIEIVDIDVFYEDRSAYRAGSLRWNWRTPNSTELSTSTSSTTRVFSSSLPPSYISPTVSLDADSLPRLSRLGLAMPDVITSSRLFGHAFFPLSRLEHLRLVLSHPRLVREREVFALFASLSETCTVLSEFVLQMRIATEGEGWRDASGVEALSFNTLRPLLRLPIVVFGLEHTYPLDMVDMEAELLARSWGGLRQLTLNRRPIILLPSKLSMSSIAAFSYWCPHLESLGLYVDGGASVRSDSRDVRRFGDSFSVLNLGLSTFPIGASDVECARVAYYLRRILPSTATISSGTWEDSIDSLEEMELDSDGELSPVSRVQLFAYEEGWSRVTDFLFSREG